MAGGNDVVRERLKLLDKYIAQLRGLAESTLEEYTSNFLIRRSTERLLHIAIESCLDIGNHLIAMSGYRAPVDNKDVFIVLGEEGLLPNNLLKSLLEMAAFRNLLVHGYTKIDDTIVHSILQIRLKDLEEFARAIVGSITNGPENDL